MLMHLLTIGMRQQVRAGRRRGEVELLGAAEGAQVQRAAAALRARAARHAERRVRTYLVQLACEQAVVF